MTSCYANMMSCHTTMTSCHANMTSCYVHSECVSIEKCRFLNLGLKGPWAQKLAPGSKSPQNWLLGSRPIHRHPYCGVLWRKCRFLSFGPKGPWTQNLAPGSKSPENWLLGSRRVHRHPYCGVLRQKSEGNIFGSFLAHFWLLLIFLTLFAFV